ncbi:MAG: hypothetical protein AAFX55_01370 [Bacteroidota bacterium]
MIKKILAGIVSIMLSVIIIGLIPLESLINNQTASDAIIVATTLLLAILIYKTILRLLSKKTQN